MARYEFDAPRLHIESILAEGAAVELTREQANYLGNVMRLTAGEAILVFNGRDGEWLARITGARKALGLEIERFVRAPEPGPDLDYLFAPLKHARLDYMVQKACEMGARRLCPVLTRRTQVSRLNLDRMRANAVEAAEQCGILSVPEIVPERRLERVLADWPADRALIFCDEDAPIADPLVALREIPRGRPMALLIGPEGGFDPGEREALRRVPGVTILSLGPRILRADTAAVAALALVQTILGDWR